MSLRIGRTGPLKGAWVLGPRHGTYRGYLLRDNPWLQLQGTQQVCLHSKRAALSDRDPVRPLADAHDRQAVDCPQAGPLAPGDFRFFDGQRQEWTSILGSDSTFTFTFFMNGDSYPQ